MAKDSSPMSCIFPELCELDNWFPMLLPSSTATSLSPVFLSSFCSDEDAGYDCNSVVDSWFGDKCELEFITTNATIAPAPSSFTSVLKLSDVASALSAFSRNASCSTFLELGKEELVNRITKTDVEVAGSCYSHCQDLNMGSLEGKRQGINSQPHKHMVLLTRTGPQVTSEVKRGLASGAGKRAVNVSSMSVTATKRTKVCPTWTWKEEALDVESNVKSGEEKGTSQNGIKNVTNIVLSARESHMESERRRRRDMRESFSVLHSLVPKLKLKRHADRITVLTEVISYIHALQSALAELDKKRADIMAQLGLPEDCFWTSTNSRGLKGGDDTTKCFQVEVRLARSDVFIALNVPKKKGVWSGALIVLESHGIEIVDVTLTTRGQISFHCIRGKLPSIGGIEAQELQDKLERLIMHKLRQ